MIGEKGVDVVRDLVVRVSSAACQLTRTRDAFAIVVLLALTGCQCQGSPSNRTSGADRISKATASVREAGARVTSFDSDIATVGTLDRFEVYDDAIQHGTFSLPSGVRLPMQRVAQLANIFPTYSPQYGYTEWGRGWVVPAFALIRRGRRGPPRFDPHDALESPWGLLWPGAGGHYPIGFSQVVAAKLVGDTVVVKLPNGETWTFGGADRVIQVPSSGVAATSRGIGVWMLARIDSVEGDTLVVDYCAEGQKQPCHDAGRYYPRRVGWRRRAHANDPTGVEVARADFSYEEAPKITDYSLGVRRVLQRRVAKVTFNLMNRDTEKFVPAATYAFRHDDHNNPYFLTRIEETRFDGQGKSETHSTTYEYGGSAFEAKTPPLFTRLRHGGSFPTFKDVEPPLHALSPGEPQLHLTPSDFNGDGITDFVGRRNRWWIFSEDSQNSADYREVRPSKSGAEDACVGVNATVDALILKPGSKSPSLFGFTQVDGSRRRWVLTQCSVEGVGLQKLTLLLGDLPARVTAECPSVQQGPELKAGGEVRRQFVDVDADGTLDLVVFDRCSIHVWKGSRSPDHLLRLEGCDPTGCRSQTAFAILLDPSKPHSIMDINGDGLGDVVEGHRSWMNRGIDERGLPMLGTLDEAVLSSAPDQPGVPGLCRSVFTNVNNDEYVDEVEHCGNTTLFVRYGSSSGFRRLAEPIVLGKNDGTVVATPVGGTPNPGVLIIGEATTRNRESDSCPSGTSPSKVYQQGQFGTEEKLMCSPTLTWLSLRAPDTGLLRAVETDRGTRMAFDYAWRTKSVEYPFGGSLLKEVRRKVMHLGRAAAGEEVQEFEYFDPWSDPESGRSGFARVDTRTSLRTGVEKILTTREYRRQGRLSWLAALTEQSPSGRTVSKRDYQRSVLGVRGVEALRLDATVDSLAHGGSGPAVGFVQRSATTYEYNATRPLCLARKKVTPASGSNQSLSVEYAYPAKDIPLEVAGAIPCLPNTITTTGRHSDSSLDFTQTDVITYSPVGKPMSIERRADSASVALKKFAYGADGQLKSSRDLDGETIFYDYEPAKRSFPAAGKSRLLKSSSGRAAVQESKAFAYAPLRDLRVRGESSSGAMKGVRGATYDAWGRIDSEWSSNSGGQNQPWYTMSRTSPTSGRPGRILETIRMTKQAARRSLVILDSSENPEAYLEEWSAAGAEWRLVDYEQVERLGATSRWRGSFVSGIGVDGSQLRYEDAVRLTARAVPTLSREVDGNGFTGTSLEYVRPDPSPGGAPRTMRQWSHDAVLDATGRLVLRARSQTPSCDPASSTCSKLFVERTLDASGLEVSRTDEGGQTTRTDHDMLGRIRRIRLPSGDVQSYDYDDAGRLTRIRRSSHSLSFGYDGMRRTREELRSNDGSVVERSERRWTNFATVESQDFEGCTGVTAACAKDRLVWTYPRNGSGLVALTPVAIGAYGRGFERAVTRRIDGSVMKDELRLSPAYDPMIRSTYEKEAWRRIVKSYSRFADSSLESVKTEVFVGKSTVPRWEIEQKMVLDESGKPREVWIDGKKLVSIERQIGLTLYSFHDGSTVALLHRDGLRTRDGVARLAPGTSFSSPKGGWTETLHRDVDGRIAKKVVTDDGGTRTFTFSYTHGQIIEVAEPSTIKASYTYSSNGLLAATTLTDGVRRAVTRSASAIAIEGGPTWTLDALGRPTSRGQKRYQWGARGQIIRVEDGPSTTDYYYDEGGQRVLATTKKGAEVARAAVAGATEVTDDEVRHDLVIDGHVFGTFVSDAKVFVPAVYDWQNTLRAKGSERAEPPTPYGVRKAATRMPGMPEFVGRRFDANTEMIRLGARDYIPELGQFASPDPAFVDAGLCVQDPAGCGLLAYAGGDPVNASDPNGYSEANSELCTDDGWCADPESTISVEVQQPSFAASFFEFLTELRDRPARTNVGAGLTLGYTIVFGAQLAVFGAVDSLGNTGIGVALTFRFGPDIAASLLGGQFSVSPGELSPGLQSSVGLTVDLGEIGYGAAFAPGIAPDGTVTWTPQAAHGRGGLSVGFGVAAEATLGYVWTPGDKPR
jgi:RHS repeat-associated protein